MQVREQILPYPSWCWEDEWRGESILTSLTHWSYCHQKGACGCDFAIIVRFSTCLDLSWTLSRMHCLPISSHIWTPYRNRKCLITLTFDCQYMPLTGVGLHMLHKGNNIIHPQRYDFFLGILLCTSESWCIYWPCMKNYALFTFLKSWKATP